MILRTFGNRADLFLVNVIGKTISAKSWDEKALLFERKRVGVQFHAGNTFKQTKVS